MVIQHSQQHIKGFLQEKQEKVSFAAKVYCHGLIGAIPFEESYEIKECYKEVVNLINSLKYDQRAALILKQIQGYSYIEIGKILGISPGNAKLKVFRARQIISDGLLKSSSRI